MPRSFHRATAGLTTFHMKYYSTMHASAERQTADLLRHTVERLWAPFTQGLCGPELRQYRFREQLDAVCVPGNLCTFQVNGQVGKARVLEDFFTILLCGFDIVEARVYQRTAAHAQPDSGNASSHDGHYLLLHTRPFLGWKPPQISPPTPLPPSPAWPDFSALTSAANGGHGIDLPVPSGGPAAAFSSLTLGGAGGSEGAAAAVPLAAQSIIKVPFTSRVECCMANNRASHVILRSPVLDLIAAQPNCPEEVRSCLKNANALQMLAGLRRAGVKPNIIAAKTLLSANQKNEAWATALGIQ